MSGRRTSAKAAVIGAGFLGRAVTARLTDSGSLAGVYTRSDPFLTAHGGLAAGLRDAETVYWLASSIRPATATREGIDRDHDAFVSLLDALDLQATRPVRVVVASSGGTVYDADSTSPHAEDAPVRPANDYGAAMVAIEELARKRAAECCIVRISNPYGPGQVAKSGQGVIAYWFDAIRRGEPITVVGNERVARDYVFIDDVVSALVAVHEAGQAPETVNIGSGRPTTLAELVQTVGRAIAPQELVVTYAPSRSFDAPSTWLNVEQAARALGWQATTELESGLRATWKFLIEE